MSILRHFVIQKHANRKTMAFVWQFGKSLFWLPNHLWMHKWAISIYIAMLDYPRFPPQNVLCPNTMPNPGSRSWRTLCCMWPSLDISDGDISNSWGLQLRWFWWVEQRYNITRVILPQLGTSPRNLWLYTRLVTGTVPPGLGDFWSMLLKQKSSIWNLR